jgi:hypothetical protein
MISDVTVAAFLAVTPSAMWTPNWIMTFQREAASPAAIEVTPPMSNPLPSSWPIVELRQYTLRPGQRDVLIDLFEREFVESQEAFGMGILGTFRDLDRPDRFVWLRGFRDMASRGAGLGAFYGGPVWKAHGKAAGATMVDSDNVFLLRGARPDSGFAAGERPRPPKGATEARRGLIVANVYPLADGAGPDFVDFFDAVVKPALQAAGGTPVASYVSETAPNNFPRLPVRENEPVFVSFSVFADPSDHERFVARLAGSSTWTAIAETLRRRLKGPPEVLRLQPTPRSALPDAVASPAAAGAGDFDFLIGDWSVAHRSRKRRLGGEDEWIEFSGPASVRKILGGLGNFDEIRIDVPGGGYRGATLRLFNPATGDWTIHWMDSRNPKLDPPMVGRFQHGTGLFFGDDTFEGRPIRVRFIWSPMTPEACRWEQAFSVDGGKTWETNWIMTFTRTPG